VNFTDFYLKYNEIHNLSTITDDMEIIYKHLLDSLLPYNLIKNNSKVLDIGCGGGFPSIPLTINNETLDFYALDSVTKKTNFVESIKNELNLSNLTVINARIEEFIKKDGIRESFDYIVARAVAPLNTLLEYSMPFLKINGILLAYKGSNYKDEIITAKKALKELNCEISDIIEYKLAEIDRSSYILIIKKLKSTDKKYPRNQNKPRLSPII